MTTPSIDHPPNLLTRFDKAETEAQIMRHTRTTISSDTTHNAYVYPSPGDLRGIPAIGRGVVGAMAGTVPHQRML